MPQLEDQRFPRVVTNAVVSIPTFEIFKRLVFLYQKKNEYVLKPCDSSFNVCIYNICTLPPHLGNQIPKSKFILCK